MRVALVLLLVTACAAKSGGEVAPAAVSGPSGPVLRVAAPQVATWGPSLGRPSELAPLSARVAVGEHEALAIERLDVRVRIDGFRARVLLDLDFTNPGEATLEGTFQVRLPDDAAPYFLAFGSSTSELGAPLTTGAEAFTPAGIMAERGGQGIALKEARVLPRAAAGRAYEATVRPEQVRVIVDPALAEWGGAGVFHARVFPITARTRHRVTIGYDQDLAPTGAGLELRLPLPPGIAARRVAIDVHAPRPEALSLEPAAPLTREGPRVRASLTGPEAEAITVRLREAGPTLLRGQDAETGPYFAARFTPALPAGAPAAGAPRALLLIDTSLSSGPRAALWRALIGELLTASRGEVKEFAALFFDVEGRWWLPRFVANDAANVEALLAAHAELAPWGATDLGAALAAAGAPEWAPTGAWDVFLFSDGAATWGEDDPAALARRLRGRRLHAYRSYGPGVDPRVLAGLARETGGGLITVGGEAEVPAAARAHRQRAWRLVEASVPGGRDLLLAGRPQDLIPGQPLVLAGRGEPPAGAKVALRVRRDGEERVVTTPLPAAIPSELTPRIFGQIAVAQLEGAGLLARAEVEGYARHFRVPGEACSLLMLESEADYARAGASQLPSGASVVQSRGVAELLATAPPRGDAKSDALAELAALPERLGRPLAVDVRAREALAAASPASFEPPAARLGSSGTRWVELPEPLRPQVAGQALDPAALALEAEQRRARRGPGDGLVAMSGLLELRPGDDALVRTLALAALGTDLPGAAATLLRGQAGGTAADAELYHLLGVALAESGRPAPAVLAFELALSAGWGSDSAPNAVGVDYLRLLTRADAIGEPALAAFMRARADELRAGAWGAGLVVQLQWSSDDTDLDLHVIEPDGAECSYDQRRTPGGGELSLDATGGRGPELYVRPSPALGAYKIGVKYFSGPRHRVSETTRALVTVYRDLGGPGERVTRHALTLQPGKAVVPVTVAEVR